MLKERWNIGLNENEGKIVAEKMLHYINSLNIITGKNEELKMIVEKIIKHIKVESNFAKKRNIMLKDGRIIGINRYATIIEEGEVSWNDAYAFIFIASEESMLGFRYPFLYYRGNLLEACISKIGKYYYNVYDCVDEDVDEDDVLGFCSVPATSLKYVAIYVDHEGYSTIEVVDLEEVVKNTRVNDIVNDILKNYSDKSSFDDSTYFEIYEKFVAQPLFDRYNFSEVERILKDYYDGDKSLVKEVTKITINYIKFFRPYRVCIDKKTWSQVNCLTIKFSE